MQNFAGLCTGEYGIGKGGKNLWLKGTRIHRIVPGFLVQGGDILHGDGTGGESIYGTCFEDEAFVASHDRAGVVSMANTGQDRNSSQVPPYRCSVCMSAAVGSFL